MKTILFLFLAICVVNGHWSHAQNVTIPDANFKAALLANNAINTNADNEIQVTEATAFNGKLSVGSGNISNLTGIEEFTALTGLNCFINQISALNLASNTMLEYLNCGNNQLTSLNLNANVNLDTLICAGNQLTTLNLSINSQLVYLHCGNNQLLNLDLSGNPNLASLTCSGNNLVNLNVAACIDLTELDCSFNELTSLNISANDLLETLALSNNSISSIDCEGKTNLSSFIGSFNLLSILDLSDCSPLTTLICPNNNLQYVNIQNGNNTLMSELNLFANPNLSCIQVSNQSYLETNWPAYQSFYGLACFNVGISENELTDFTIYPNPTNGLLNFPDVKDVALFDCTGKQQTPRTMTSSLNLTDFANGVYYLMVYGNETQKEVVKIVKN